jgi:hypothetical protein
MDPSSTPATGLTSAGNVGFVKGLDLYDQVVSYDDIAGLAHTPTVVVDMSGNARVLASLQDHLGDNLKYCINVGLTNWDEPSQGTDIPKERREMFFAPGHLQRRSQEWGATVLDQRTTAFMMQAGVKAQAWVSYQTHEGLRGLEAAYRAVARGQIAPDKGLVIQI